MLFPYLLIKEIMKSTYKAALAKLKLFKLNDLSKFKHVDIPRVPHEWTKAEGSEDMHLGIPNIDEYTAVLYIGMEGSVYPPHKHKYSSEQITILNEDGEIEITTEEETKILKFPESFHIKPNMVHAFKFNTKTKIIVWWTPSFENGIIKVHYIK